jgi:hypothetical protein
LDFQQPGSIKLTGRLTFSLFQPLTRGMSIATDPYDGTVLAPEMVFTGGL